LSAANRRAIPNIYPPDKKHKLVLDLGWVVPQNHKWGDNRWTVYKQRVKELWPSRSPAFPSTPDQLPENKAGPDPKPKETLETRLIDLMRELKLKSGMLPREVRKAIKARP